MSELDATEIWPNLYQGSLPRTGRTVRNHGFDVLVLCAIEHQLPAHHYPGVEVLHAPLDDTGAIPSSREIRIAVYRGREVADIVSSGGRCLVTCMQGRNRSGLIVALALRNLTGWSADHCIQRIRSARPNALTNRAFVHAIRHLPVGRG